MSGNHLNDLSKIYLDKVYKNNTETAEADKSRLEDLGGPTPDNYRSDDNSAQIKTEGYQRDPEGQEKDRKRSKQTDPSKAGFTGIGDSIEDIMKQNAAMKKAAAKKKTGVSEGYGKGVKMADLPKGSKVRVKKGVKVQGKYVNERTLSSYIPSDRKGEAHRANLDYTKAQLKKKEDESTKNRGDLSKRDAGKMAKERLHNKKIMSLGEEGYDRMRDDRLVKYGIGHDGSDRKGSTSRPTGKQPKGDTNYQKEMKKKYGGKLPSAMQVVTDKIKEKYGKGAIHNAK